MLCHIPDTWKRKTYCLDFLPCDCCVTGVIIILVGTLHFRICCVTDVLTETVPAENTNIIQISTVFATAKVVQLIAINCLGS